MVERESLKASIAEKTKEINNGIQEKAKTLQEFQNYKVKAQLALQQSSVTSGMDGKITELQEINAKLELKIKYIQKF